MPGSRPACGQFVHNATQSTCLDCSWVHTHAPVRTGHTSRGLDVLDNRQPSQTIKHRRHTTSLNASLSKKLNWRALWKNRISSISMKLRKSLVKPVTQQNISSCSVLSHEIVMHDSFNVILWTSAGICVVVYYDLGWKNRTTRCNKVLESWLQSIRIHRHSFSILTAV